MLITGIDRLFKGIQVLLPRLKYRINCIQSIRFRNELAETFLKTICATVRTLLVSSAYI